MEWTDDYKCLMVSRHEAALIMDSVTVSHPLTRDLALQVASLVLEVAAQEDVEEATQLFGDTHRRAGSVPTGGQPARRVSPVKRRTMRRARHCETVRGR